MICLSSKGYTHILTGNILYLSLLNIVKNYLIKLWVRSTSDFVNQITWSTNKKAEDFIKEVSESLPKNIRATIEEKDERATEKTR
tara:strand:- start:61 stop:315 length:255 start_codon:yes stop_codon:yes gene_type:complete